MDLRGCLGSEPRGGVAGGCLNAGEDLLWRETGTVFNHFFLRSLRFKGHGEHLNTPFAACPPVWGAHSRSQGKIPALFFSFHSLTWGGWLMLEILPHNCQDK